MDPRLEASVIEPRVTITKSFLPTSTSLGETAPRADDAFYSLAVSLLRKDKIGNAGVQLESYPALLKPFLERTDHGVVLVEDRAHDPLEMVESGDHVRKPQQIASELDGAMPGLERETLCTTSTRNSSERMKHRTRRRWCSCRAFPPVPPPRAPE
jgi:hypothetical protein